MPAKAKTAEAVALNEHAPASSPPLPDEELSSLRRLLRRAEGFALALVRSNVPGARLVARLVENPQRFSPPSCWLTTW